MTQIPLHLDTRSPEVEFWDSVADEYPEKLSILYEKKKQFDRALVPIGRGARILDAGCGKGWDALYLSDRGFSEVYAVDHSPEMTERALSYVRQSKRYSNNIKIFTDDILALPFSKGFFDVTCCFSVIDHIPTRKQREQAIEELVRVTKPGGLLVLTFPNSDSLPALLRKNKGMVVRPGRSETTDFVEVVSRSGSTPGLEYQSETTYSWNDMAHIARTHGLVDAHISTGVMTNVRQVRSRNAIAANGFRGEGTEFLLDRVVDQKLREEIDLTIERWLDLPAEKRGVRLGLVGGLPVM